MLNHVKLHQPRTPPNVVQRPRVLERLDSALEHPLAVISAGPGFGKTTLAAQWVEQRPVRSSWLLLDHLDENRDRFSIHFVESLRKILPGGLRRSERLLRARTPPPWAHFIEVLTSEMEQPPEPSILVLEDYHAVSSGDVADLLERVVEALPERFNLLVLTRVDPPWPLARWRARGLVDELRSRELRFSIEETRAFFDLHPELRLDDEAVEIVHGKTEGWIAGLRLAAMSLAAADNPESRARELSGSDRNLTDFLVEDVLAGQPREVREFLAVAAQFDRFCASLCDRVLEGATGSHDSQRMLARLESQNMFLVPLDSERKWYRFHHLFQDVIVQRSSELAPPQILARVDSRAATWFAEHGLITEALRHWIAAGDLDSAAALVGRHVDSTVGEDLSRRALSRWLAIFPVGAERDRLPLLVARGCLKIIHWDLAGLAEILEQADPLNAAEGGLFSSNLEALRSFLLYWKGDVEDSLRSARKALRMRPPIGGLTHLLATVYVAGGLRQIGRKAEALRFLDKAIAEAARHGHTAVEFVVVQGILHLYSQEFDAVRQRASQLLAAHEREPVSEYWLGYGFHLLGMEAYERNRLQEAANWFRRIKELRYLVTSRLYQDAIVGLALVALAEGDRAAEGHAAAVRAWAIEIGDSTSLRIADSLDLRLGLANTRTSWFEGKPPLADDHQWFWLEVPTVTWAERLVSDASPEVSTKALPYIESALQRMCLHHNVRQATILTLLRALALDADGRRDDALDSLSATLSRAEPYGLVRTFLDRGPRLKALLDALSKDGHDGYREMLRGAFLEQGRSGRRTNEPDLEPWKVLSYRELEVLEMLAERLTDKEIAVRLRVTPGAIKKRTHGIYRKLEAGDRREAVARAIARGILKTGS